MREQSTSESELVAAAKSGDEDAFLDLLLIHGDEVRAKLRQERMPLDRDLFDVEDIMQHTFCTAWTKLDAFNYERPGAFAAWMIVIGRNEMRRVRRAAATTKRGGDLIRVRTIRSRDQSAVTTIMSKLAEAGGSELSKLAKLDEVQQLSEALDQLAADEQQLIWYHYKEGLTSKQIGERLSLAPGSIRARLHKTRKKLGVLLGKNKAEE